MNKKIEKRVLEEAVYIKDNKETIRNAAKYFNVSKSTIHKDMQEKLIFIDPKLYKIIKNVFNYHIKIRHINGGEATKQKYLKLKSI